MGIKQLICNMCECSCDDDLKIHEANIYFNNCLYVVCKECLDYYRKTTVKEVDFDPKSKHLYNIEIDQAINEFCCHCKQKTFMYVLRNFTTEDDLIEDIDIYKLICEQCFDTVPEYHKHTAIKFVTCLENK